RTELLSPLRQGCRRARAFASARRGDLRLAAQAELIAVADRHPVTEDHFDHLLAVDRTPLLVAQGRDDLLRPGVDHLASRGIGPATIETERDPAWLLTQDDARPLPGRHHRRVEDVEPGVGGVADPHLPLVGRQADTVTGTAMPLDLALLEPRHLNTMQF